MRFAFLDRDAVKILAALTMLVDHAGLLLFAGSELYLPMRAIGRVAFPLFAYLFAEGCIFTKNRRRHFLSVLLLGAVCQGVYIFAMGAVYPLNILLTLSLAMLLTFAVENLKRAFLGESSRVDRAVAVPALLLLLGGTVLLNIFFTFDYGLLGCVLPPLCALFDLRSPFLPDEARRRDTPLLRIAVTGVIAAALTYIAPFGTLQLYALLAVPILLLYNGREGRYRLKWAFYLFYPLHLAALSGIRLLLLLLR